MVSRPISETLNFPFAMAWIEYEILGLEKKSRYILQHNSLRIGSCLFCVARRRASLLSC